MRKSLALSGIAWLAALLAASIGAWSVYPYLPSGTIIVSDGIHGLFILTLQP